MGLPFTVYRLLFTVYRLGGTVMFKNQEFKRNCLAEQILLRKYSKIPKYAKTLFLLMTIIMMIALLQAKVDFVLKYF